MAPLCHRTCLHILGMLALFPQDHIGSTVGVFFSHLSGLFSLQLFVSEGREEEEGKDGREEDEEESRERDRFLLVPK